MLLVTGATGFLGRAVLRALARDAHEVPVRVFVRRRDRLPAGARVEVADGDLGDAAAVDRAVRDCDRVLHLAAVTHASAAARYHAVNVEGTRALVDAARRHGVRRLVFASSRAIDPSGGAYARSKRDAEAVVAGAIPDCVILRFAELYGDEGGRGVGELIGWIRAHRWVPVLGGGRDTLAPLHVDDAALATVRALAVGTPGAIYTLTGPESLTCGDVVRHAARALGQRRRTVTVPVWLAAFGVRVAARLFPGRVAPDQVARLTSPKAAMPPGTMAALGVEARSFLDELPRLVRR